MVVVVGALALVVAWWPAPAGGAIRHRTPVHRVCKVVKVPTARRGHRRTTRRVRVCATSRPVGRRRLSLHRGSGGFPPPLRRQSETDTGEARRLPVGPFRRALQGPTSVALPGGSAAAAVAHAAGTGVSEQATRLLPPSSFPASVWNPTGVHAAQEPSVASAGRIVLYTMNWDAGYSVDGGQTFTEIDPHTTFPATNGGFCCDQVVIYDRVSNRFIWVLQYDNNSSGENVIRVAYTSPANLARYGSKAWSWFDLSSRTLAGAGFSLDQPRLGLTDRYLYMNINQADTKVHKTVIVRIPRAGFANAGGPGGYGYALLDPWSLRVAQNVVGPTEYFVGHENTSTLRVASIDDNSNVILTQDIPEPTVADHNWAMTTPGGDDMMARQAASQATQITGVTQDGDGTLWAAWSQGRGVVDRKGNVVTPVGQPTQPHIAVAVLSVAHPQTGQPPVIASKHRWSYWNVNYALAMPDLATTAAGEVAIVFDWGGGTQYLNHAVGFLSGGLVDQTVALGNSDPTQKGDPAGDYQTVRPEPPPQGNCLVAAGAVNQGTNVGYPVFTVFSRIGVKCTTRFITPPVTPSPPIGPIAQPTTLTLTCPGTVNAHQRYTISGTLSPALGGAPVTLTYRSSASGTTPVTHTVSTSSSGTFFDTAFSGSPPGTETIDAKYPGDETHAASKTSCTFGVQQIQ